MDAKAFDKSKLPSRHVTEGPSRAPHRSYCYAMGLTGKTLAQNLEIVKFNENQKVVFPVSDAISPAGDVVGLQGSLAPESLESAGQSLSERRFAKICGPGGARPQGRGHPCRRRG
jgi:dihydroxyacid dehydratase/phosphogluconate dehydratase